MPDVVDKSNFGMDSRDIGAALKKRRKELRLTAEQIMLETGIPTASYLSALEAGTYNAANSKYLPALVRILRLSIDAVKEINPDLFIEVVEPKKQANAMGILLNVLELPQNSDFLFLSSETDFYAEDGKTDDYSFLSSIKAMRIVTKYIKEAKHFVYGSKATQTAIICQSDLTKVESIAYRSLKERKLNSAPQFLAGRDLELIGSITAYYTFLETL
jgi:transcriptional regulator with XRE-family HTH domain